MPLPPRLPRSITATKRATPTSRALTRKVCCNQASALVDLAAYQSSRHALSSGVPADFEKIVARRTAHPQRAAGWPGVLPGLPGRQPVHRPARAGAGERGLCDRTRRTVLGLSAARRRVHRLSDRAVAAQAAAELSTLPHYAGPRDAANQVTPDLLFRGASPARRTGPYLSQFLLQPTALGSLPIIQKYMTNVAAAAWRPPTSCRTPPNSCRSRTAIHRQNLTPGHDAGIPARWPRARRLYPRRRPVSGIFHRLPGAEHTQGPVPNPGNPYIGSDTQNGFATLGQPDIAATLAAVAARR